MTPERSIARRSIRPWSISRVSAPLMSQPTTGQRHAISASTPCIAIRVVVAANVGRSGALPVRVRLIAEPMSTATTMSKSVLCPKKRR